jgi:N-acetylgalactosamine-6-sulfatase
VRVPFLAKLPGRIPAGRVDTHSVLTAVDFMPTLTKLAGVSVPAGHKLDGEDVGDILAGKNRPRDHAIYWEWRFRVHGYHVNRSPMLAMRDGEWRLLLNPDRSRAELYNIPVDPSETTNLAEKKPDIVDRMAKAALQWQKQLPDGPRDPDAGKNDYPMPQERPGKRG